MLHNSALKMIKMLQEENQTLFLGEAAAATKTNERFVTMKHFRWMWYKQTVHCAAVLWTLRVTKQRSLIAQGLLYMMFKV